MTRIKVAVNGYGVIGKRVADAVALQSDMELAGVADVVADYRIKLAADRGYPVFASSDEAVPGDPRGRPGAGRDAGPPARRGRRRGGRDPQEGGRRQP